MKTTPKVCRRCSMVSTRMLWVCGKCEAVCCEHRCTAKTSVKAFYSKSGKNDRFFATCGKCWLGKSGWTLIPPGEIVKCDLCGRPPVFRYPLGGLRCRTCPRPES